MSLSLRLEVFFALSILFSFFSWGKRVLFPFQIFTTWVHECWHAITALLLGGSSIRITIDADGSGLTQYKIENDRLKQALIASSGYLGASLSGCLLFYLTVKAGSSIRFFNTHGLLMLLCSMTGLSLIFWIRNVFGAFSTLLIASVFAGLLFYPKVQSYAHDVLLFLAIQTALNALFDIRTLFGLSSSKKQTSDAHQLQKLFFLPHWIWAILWLAISVCMMLWTLQKTLGLSFQF